MAKTYEIKLGTAKNLHEILQGVQGSIQVRAKVKKVIKKLRTMPDHGIDPELRQHFWGADFDAPVLNAEGSLVRYKFAEGVNSNTKRLVKLSPNLVETVIWEQALKPILEKPQCTPSMDEQIEEICGDFQLTDAFERLLIGDDDDTEDEEPAEGDQD